MNKSNIFIELKYTYIKAPFYIKMIIAYIILFLFIHILQIISGYQVFKILGLPSNWNTFFAQPWSILTYAFIHEDFWHLTVNMVFLYYTSEIFKENFPYTEFYKIFVFGIILGGLFFLVTNDLFFDVKYPLYGASAGIIAVFAFVSFIKPKIIISPLGLFSVYLVYILLFILSLDLLSFFFHQSTTGLFAHIGGIIAGLWYSINKRYTLNERNKEEGYFHTELRTNKRIYGYKNKNQLHVDRILDKISRSGYNSLSSKEKKFLEEQSNSN